MKKSFSALAAIISAMMFVLFSCRTGISSQNEFLNTRNIPGQSFRFTNETDTVFRTSHASLVKVRKGTFSGPVDIEIKEVFTPAEILRSGLGTTSNGQPLKSGGMIYFNATENGNAVEPELSVSISIPAVNADSAMQLFKGEWTYDSTMNWVQSTSLDSIQTFSPGADTLDGRWLYHSRCSSCHGVFTDQTGPALRGFNFRGPWRNPLNALSWVNNPAAFTVKDPYTRDLKNKYGSIMTAFPDVSLQWIQQLTLYVNSVTPEQLELDKVAYRKKHPVDTTTSNHGYDEDTAPCGYDSIYISATESFDVYDTVTSPLVLDDTIPAQSGAPVAMPLWDFIQAEKDKERQRYDFKIESNGWYNVDAFLKQEDKAVPKNVKLTAKLQTNEDVLMTTYVFIPTERVMQQGFPADEKKTVDFKFNIDGTIPLPLGYRALIVSIGTAGEKILYGVSEFILKNEQVIPVELKETTAEKLKYILQSKSINGVSLEAIEKEKIVFPVNCDSINVNDTEK